MDRLLCLCNDSWGKEEAGRGVLSGGDVVSRTFERGGDPAVGFRSEGRSRRVWRGGSEDGLGA